MFVEQTKNRRTVKQRIWWQQPIDLHYGNKGHNNGILKKQDIRTIQTILSYLRYLESHRQTRVYIAYLAMKVIKYIKSKNQNQKLEIDFDNSKF